MLKIVRELGVKVSLLFDGKGAKEAHKRIEEVSEGLRDVGMHVAEAGAALLGLAKIQGTHARALEENSQQLGINVERLQELQYAAEVAAGVSREELTGSLEGLSKTLFDARNNSVEAARTLIRLGVPLSDISDKSVTADQILLRLSDRFKEMPDGMYKTALANEAFGGSGAKLIPLLNKGAKGIASMGLEGRKLGVVMDESMIKRGADFDRTFTKVWLVLKNITFVIGDSIIKAIEPVIIQFQKFIVQNRQFIALGIAAVFKSLGNYLQVVFKVLAFLIQRFAYLVKILGGVERVSKAIALALGIFTGFKLISSLGILGSSLKGLLVVFSGLSLASIAWGAAILGVLLIVQDLFSDDSLIKEWFKKIEEQFPVLNKFIDLIQSMMDLMGGGKGGNPAAAFGGKNESGGFLSGIADGWKSLKNMDLGKLNPFSSMATASPAAQSGAAGSMSQQNQMQANITVNVPQGTTAKQASDIVSSGVNDGFTNMLRQARNQNLGGRSY